MKFFESDSQKIYFCVDLGRLAGIEVGATMVSYHSVKCLLCIGAVSLFSFRLPSGGHGRGGEGQAEIEIGVKEPRHLQLQGKTQGTVLYCELSRRF